MRDEQRGKALGSLVGFAGLGHWGKVSIPLHAHKRIPGTWDGAIVFTMTDFSGMIQSRESAEPADAP